MLKITLIREGKTPPDTRVALTPDQCKKITSGFPVDIKVQPSPNRCFSDSEYQEAGMKLQETLDDRDILLGIKEVPIDQLVANKLYLFFSHTIKKQAYNRKLLQAILAKKIWMIDYEVLVNEKGRRVIAFGRWAGMVGAHNGLYTWFKRTGRDFPRMNTFKEYADAKAFYKTISDWPPIKIVLTGTGRVANGAAEVLNDMGIAKLSPKEYLTYQGDQPVYTQLSCSDYAARKDGEPLTKPHFYEYPKEYKSIFDPYLEASDLMINGIYWDNDAPVFFTLDQMRASNFRIKVIADVTCDIAPISSIPSTVKASTIADPIFGFDPQTEQETTPHQDHVVDMMTIDNLPNELPRDASRAFGNRLIDYVLQELLNREDSDMITRATVARDGKLGPHFGYLEDYVNG